MFLLLALCSFAPHFEAFIGQHRFMFVLFAILSVIMKFVSDYISSRTLTFAFPLCYILLGILLAFGIEGAERIARMYRREGVDVTIEHGPIPLWGSDIPTSSTYRKTELGYRVIVDDHRPAGSYGLQRNG